MHALRKTKYPTQRILALVAAAIVLSLPTSQAAPAAPDSGGAHAGERFPRATNDSTRVIEGWTVHIRAALWTNEAAATETALSLLRQQLVEIVRVVPAPAVTELRKVRLWFSPPYPGVRPTAEYHPAAGWLRSNGRDPVMAKGIEFTDIRDFQKEMRRMPNFALHELAHAYHDRVLVDGFANAEIKAAFNRAKASGAYDKVERSFGNDRPHTFEKSYAMTSPQEYFAESTEAFFSRNDFFPFNRQQLEQHDPQMYHLLQRLWNTP